MPPKRGIIRGIVFGVAYYATILVFKLSRLPVVGGFFEGLGTDARLEVVTVPIDVRIERTSAIMPFDAIGRLVDAASYVAIRDTCICRQSHGCKEYPLTPGCVYLGEGARTIRHGVRRADKEEALAWLEKARAMGLVTNLVWWSSEFRLIGADAPRTIEICSCCPCCCLMFKTKDASKAYTDSILGFGICRVVDADACARCTDCEQACPFKAIRVDMHEGPVIDAGRCKGCGRCEAVCRTQALKVFPKQNGCEPKMPSGQSTADPDERFERFLAMVR